MNPNRTERGISREQISIIHLAKARLGMDEDAYRALLQRAAGVRSSKELDAAGFAAVMAEFKRLGFSGARRQAPSFGNRYNMATPKQISAICSLWRQYAGRHDEEGLRRWMQKRFGVSHLRFVDRTTVPKLLTALTRMAEWRESHPRTTQSKRNPRAADSGAQAALPLTSSQPPF